MNRELIRNGAILAVALSLTMVLPTTKSKAQPLGPSLSQMQSQTQVPVYEKAQARRVSHRGRHWRGGRRWARGPRLGFRFGFGPRRRHCWRGPHGRRHCRWR
jgi:hypothetical protein